MRGSGLVFGAEFVTDAADRAPDTDLTAKVVNEMRQRGFLLSALGRFKSTLKIRPPMTFQVEHVDLLMDTLDEVITEFAA